MCLCCFFLYFILTTRKKKNETVNRLLFVCSLSSTSLVKVSFYTQKQFNSLHICCTIRLVRGAFFHSFFLSSFIFIFLFKNMDCLFLSSTVVNAFLSHLSNRYFQKKKSTRKRNSLELLENNTTK